MAKILVVDDEINILELIKFNLVKEGHDVLTATNGEQALEIVQLSQPDLILLDIMLPGIDGYEICRRLRAREETADVPIIMLTAKDDEIDKVLSLEMGADDHVTKPFSPRELSARIRARLRSYKKAPAPKAETISLGPILMKPDQYQVFFDEKPVELTLKEFELLKILITNPGKVIKRDYLLKEVWGYDFTTDSRTVDVHVHYLRNKIDPDSTLIETVRGIGYRLKD